MQRDLPFVHDVCSQPGNGCAFWWRCLSLICLLFATGCSGCRPESERLTREEIEKRSRESQEKREAIVASELVSLPADSDSRLLFAKPGHWFETRQEFKSNREDLQILAVGSVGRGDRVTPLPGTNILNEFTRRTSLPKGQTKSVDLQYFVPYSAIVEPEDWAQPVSNQLTFRTELLSWPLLTPLTERIPKPANELKAHEFQLLVLSPEALAYDFLGSLDAVFWRNDDSMADERIRSYHVRLVKPVKNQYSLPRSMLTMTSIAVVVWDDVAAEDVSREQQQALIDWVHWGGQLVVSGPSSWTRLQNSFLSPYLPADSADSTLLETADFVELSAHWEVEDRSHPKIRESLVVQGAAIAGLNLKLNTDGAWLPGTGHLVAERQVGRGRVVLTAFPLRETRINRWNYFSSFLSSGLLRRASRAFTQYDANQSLAQMWAGPFKGAERDPRMHSNFRILSRDLPLSANTVQELGETRLGELGTSLVGTTRSGSALNTPGSTQPGDAAAVQGQGNSGRTVKPSFAGDASAVAEEHSASPMVDEAMRWGGGGAAWNDFSGLSHSALTALRSAAGIVLPTRTTILYLLAGYLFCLVPVNWLLFRLMGRLEYAWLAAPILALVGVVVVTSVARLDIGFARRTTEISVLELHGSYPRGHLTQYVALYTSLSTNYAVELPENGSVALPSSDVSRTDRRAVDKIRNLRTNYGRSAGVTLEPLTVYSNSTEMLHAEQMIEFSGGIQLGKLATGEEGLKNRSELNLKSTQVLRCADDGTIHSAWVGALESGGSAALRFQRLSSSNGVEGFASQWMANPITSAQQISARAKTDSEADSELWIGGVMLEVLRKTPLMPGQMRLIGYTDDHPGQLNIIPTQDQLDVRCVVVAHLLPQTLGPITPDANIQSRRIAALDKLLQDDPPNSEEPQEDVSPSVGEPGGEPPKI
ncbi:hypothetical protein [Aureliella helgolandensis]|uniref:Transmembrane protein n=1 Tax=Aureliella helgolandensis TaxID=2527968 RepID=A0A518G690_9BACT|nr:hypothetical protein [Aureliella helgolandensis]QDV24102.1 hypothetical protein Q31a_24150 [Aureliella helgolandensis]